MRHIRIEGDVAYVALTKGYEAIIDADAAPLVASHKWGALIRRRKDGSVRAVYAYRKTKAGASIYMHRVIAQTPDGLATDHIDADGLNNRRANLRTSTISQNGCNQRVRPDSTSGIKGVSWMKDRGKWQAQIGPHGRRVHLGRFATIEAAASAYAKASAELHGEFGRVK